MANIHGIRCATEAFGGGVKDRRYGNSEKQPLPGDVALCKHGVILLFMEEHYESIRWRELRRVRNYVKYREAMAALTEESREKNAQHPDQG